MPKIRGTMLGHKMSGLCGKLNRQKTVDDDVMNTPLKRCLTTFEITLLGVGHMVGAGIYVLTGTVAHSIAGPAVILSFLIAAIASVLSAFCYAELGARVPKAGSAYVYTYVAVGEFWAFVIGWNIILEHMIGAASVARAWSGYVDSLSDGAFTGLTITLIRAVFGVKDMSSWGMYLPDPFAAAICIGYAYILGCGVKHSAALNTALTIANLSVMVLVIGLGFKYADFNNWSDEYGGFFPWGINGVMAGAATCFYAFVGFDSIATAGEEALNPAKSIPLATGISMLIVTVGYVLVSGTLTLVVPFDAIKPVAALPEAFASKGVYWAKYVISAGALCGMTTTLFGSLFSLPRIMYAMASDGLLFACFGRVNERTQVPVLNLAVSGGVSALLALIFDIRHLVEFMSIGTFLAYTIVSASVIILRYRPEDTAAAGNMTRSVSATPSDIKSPPTEGADSNSAGNSVHSPVDSEYLHSSAGVGSLKRHFHKLSCVIGDWEPGTAVVAAVIIYTTGCVCLNLIPGDQNWFTLSLQIYFGVVVLGCIVVIDAHQQSPATGKYRVPMVPHLPAISIYINIHLMAHLSPLTWFRFVIWMFVGMFIYFLYGIHNSKLAATGPSSYSTLMTSAEAERAIESNRSGESSQKKKSSDKVPIICSEGGLD